MKDLKIVSFGREIEVEELPVWKEGREKVMNFKGKIPQGCQSLEE